MRQDRRNYRDRDRDRYNDYRNDYRDQDYGRDQNRNRIEERDYGYGPDRSGQEYNRSYEGRDFNPERGTNRGYEQENSYGRGPGYERRRDYERDREYNQYRGHNQGRYHSTETEVPGRGYDTEWEMNRHANNYSRFSDRDYDQRDPEARRRVLNNSVASSHRATGPYEDYERDLNRFGMRRDYQDRYESYNRQNRDRDRGRQGNRGQYFRPEEEMEGRSRVSERFRDRGLDRSQRGNWGPGESEYNDRFGGGRGR